MKNPFAGLFRARDKPQDSVSAAPTFYFGTSGSGKPVNANTAIQLSTVYACVRVISETVASLPLGVYEAKEDGNRKATEHPLYLLLHDEPNSEMTSFVLREVMLAHLLLWGNSYCQIIRSGRNQVTGLYPLLPDKMTVDRDKKGILTYTYMTSTGEQVVLSPEDVLHIPGLFYTSPVSALMGSWVTAPSRWRKTPSAWASRLRSMAVSSSLMVHGLPVS